MRNRLFPIVTALALMLFETGCRQVVPSTPAEPATQTPEPVVEIPPVEQITPTWIYAIIGIGAALAVVMIIYIVRGGKSKS